MSNNPYVHEEEYRGKGYRNKLDLNILICGCGTLGSNLAHNLVRTGFSDLALLDLDRVEMHNLSTQSWNAQDVGLTKTAALANQLFDINQTVNISEIYKKLDKKNAKKILNNRDLVVDCFDNTEARRLLKEFCQDTGTPCIHAGLFEDYGEVFWNNKYVVPQEDPNAIDVCDYPLARNIAMLTVTVLSEEILDYALNDNPRMKNWQITLRDLKIRGV